jgi:hypothetical protein
MAILTTYTCDISGKQGIDRKDFIDLTLSGVVHLNHGCRSSIKTLSKLIHIDTAKSLGLVAVELKKDEAPIPVPTLESVLKAIIYDGIKEIVNNELDDREI